MLNRFHGPRATSRAKENGKHNKPRLRDETCQIKSRNWESRKQKYTGTTGKSWKLKAETLNPQEPISVSFFRVFGVFRGDPSLGLGVLLGVLGVFSVSLRLNPGGFAELDEYIKWEEFAIISVEPSPSMIYICQLK